MKKRKQVVFIEGFSMPMTYKIARTLKKKGYGTVLIRLLMQTQEDKNLYNEAYDKVIDLKLVYYKVTKENFLKIIISNLKKVPSLILSFIKILKLRPYVIIGRAPLSAPIDFFRKLFKKNPFIYFPYDIRSQALLTLEEAMKKMPLFEIKADKFCFENSDGIMHKGAPNELNYLNGRALGDVKLPKFQIHFHPYCSKEFCVPINKDKLSKKDREFHLVYIGGALKPNKAFYLDQFNLYKKIMEQKIHVHFYFSSEFSHERNLNEEEKVKKSFLEDFKDYPYIKYFHLHNPFNPKELVSEISKYDFGTFNPKFDKGNGLEPRFCTGNKISTYLEAGIPFFYMPDYKFIGELMKKYKINLPYPKNLNDLKKFIEKLDYKQLEKNVLKARQDFDMDKNFPRLEQFVKKVVASKSK